ncbi:hypothetical protein Tco_1212779 [Tanacetum coccineum]
MDKIRLSRAQILWGMFHKKNINYVYLLWEDLLFQIENKDAKKTNKMSYPRFTKIIIDYFMSKDLSIPRRNKMFWHTARDDTMFTSMRSISRHEDTQVFGTILHELIQTSMLESKAYQTYYAFASGAKAPKPKLKSKAKVAKPDKKKQPAKRTKAKGSTVLSEVTLTEAEKIKLATKRSKKDFHVSHESGSGDGVDTQSKVPGSMKLKEEDDRCSSSSKYENSCDEDNMYLASKMKEAVDVAVQLQTNKLIEEAQAENQEFLSQVDSTMKDEDPSAGSDRGTKRRKSGKDVESSIDSRSKEKKLSMPQELRVRTEIMIEQPADKEVTKADWFKKLKRPPTPDPDWSKRRQIELSTLSGHGLDRHSTAQRALARVFTELEYTIFENVSPQAITERLDLDNPENKHLEYLKGGDSSRRYSTSVTKTKAATYELKWIEDLMYCHSKAVEDLQLGVESYQKKLNLTKPDTYRSNIRNKTAYTSHSDPHGIIYVDQFKRKRLMGTDELYKFSDWHAL